MTCADQHASTKINKSDKRGVGTVGLLVIFIQPLRGRVNAHTSTSLLTGMDSLSDSGGPLRPN